MGAARRLGMVAAMAALVLASACGRETKQTVSVKQTAAKTTAFTGDPESAYCRLALEWAVVEMTPRDGSPAAEEKYWTDYVDFLERADSVAPAAIESDFHTYADNGVNQLPVMRKYGFDEKRFMSEATEADKKVVMENPPGADEAFSRILRYEWQVCGNGTPEAATDVTFTGDKNSAYCKGQAEGSAAFQKVVEGGFKPADVKAFSTSKEFTEGLAKKLNGAPAEIKSDVEADVNWVRTKQLPAMAKWDYDFKKVKLQAPAADRFAIDLSDPEIRDHEARLNAYDSQVCGL
jgi:hypothetical protein